MGKFEFRNRTVELDIAGNKFAVEADTRIGDRMKEFGEIAQKMAKEKASNEEGLTFCKAVITELLGENAIDAIFKGREILLDDCVDILVYVAEEVTRFRKSINGNRAQRRATK